MKRELQEEIKSAVHKIHTISNQSEKSKSMNSNSILAFRLIKW